MGRRKIAIEKIDNLNKRYVAFSKRKEGLFKKAETACRMYGGGSQIAVVVFSPTVGKLHTFGPVDSLIDQFRLHQSSNPPPPPLLHLNSSTATVIEQGIKKRSRSQDDDDDDVDDQLLMLMEERETKKRKLLMGTTTTTTEEAAAATEEEEEDRGLLMNNEFLMGLEQNIIDQLRFLRTQGEEVSDPAAAACCTSNLLLLPSPSVDATCSSYSSASELKDDDYELNEFLNGFADEIIAEHHHYYEKDWATIDDWDQVLNN